MKIACIGAGYVGGTSMSVIADRCPDCQISVTDVDGAKIDAWNSSNLPIREKGLDEIIARVRNRNLFFHMDTDAAIYEASMIFICVNTPTKTYGEGSGKAADLKYIESCIRRIAAVSRSDKIIIEKSTVPVKTSEIIKKILTAEASSNIKFEVLSNPEFLAEGTAIMDIENPDRVLIGGGKTRESKQAINKLISIYERWVSREKIITTDIWSSELAKLVANAFLAQRISSINSISALCEKTGADITELSRIIGADSRIGSKFLKASVGFGGSCFHKDISSLVYICEHFGLKSVADYWEQVISINEWQKKRFTRKIINTLFGSVSGKRIALYGFSFKKETGDTRESPAIAIGQELLENKAELAIYDPMVSQERIYTDLNIQDASKKMLVDICQDPYSAAKDAHAIIILTDWDEFKTLNYKKIKSMMLNPSFLFDGAVILDVSQMRNIGFDAYSVGRE